MKRFLKVSMLIALVMLLAGVLLTVAGRAAGGRRQLSQLISEKFLVTFYSNGDGGIEFDDSREIWTDDFQEELSGQPGKLNIEAAGISVRVMETEEKKIQVEGKNSEKVQCYVEDDTLYVKARGREELLKDEASLGVVYLYLPSGMQFEEAAIDLGAGEVNMDVLNTGRLDCSVGAGSLNITRPQADTVYLDLGMGEINLYEATLKDVELDVGMGAAYLDGSITGDVTGACGMGSLTMALAGAEEEHNYKVRTSMGSVSIGEDMGDAAGNWDIDHGADSNFDLSCAMGSIEIYFTNSEG